MFLLSFRLEHMQMTDTAAVMDLFRGDKVLPQGFKLDPTPRRAIIHLPEEGTDFTTLWLARWITIDPISRNLLKALNQIAGQLYQQLRLIDTDHFHPLTLALIEVDTAVFEAETTDAILLEKTPQLVRAYSELDFFELADVVERTECVKIRAPHWFQREDFQEWRKRQPYPFAALGATTCDPSYEDVLMTFDRHPNTDYAWEGSHVGETCELPSDIHEIIGRLLKSRNLRSGLLWINPI